MDVTPDKIEAVRRYVRASFPGQAIMAEWRDRNSGGYGFRVVGRPRTAVIVAAAFLEDKEPSEIETTLSAWGLAERMRVAAPSTVQVTHEGLGPIGR